jgi:putative ABC transport system permease protein
MTSHIKIILRAVQRKPVYSVITFSGFTAGIAAALLIYLWIYNELGYEKFHPDYQRIYRILTLSRQGDEIVKSPNCYRPVPKTMKMDYPQIEYATYISYQSQDSPLRLETGGEKIEARSCWTNEDFFKVFEGFKFLEGNAETAFSKPDNIVLSEKTAKKIFGNQPSLGKVLISDEYSKQVLTVGGVVRIPEQSHIDFGYMFSESNSRYSSYSNNWGDKGFVRCYIKLRKDAKVDSTFINQLSNHISRYSNITDKLMFQPLSDIHLYSDYPNDSFDKNPGSYKYVWIYSGLALIIILMASLNYSALSVARASERYTEIGIRKTTGADRSGVYLQFMSESVFQTFAATVIAIIFVWLFLPVFNTLASRELSLNFTPKLFFNLFLFTFIVGVIAGFYPAVYLSSFSPISVFRGVIATGSRHNFIRLLVTVQFTAAIFFIIATIVFVRQLNFVFNKDLGIDGKNVIAIPTGLWYGNREFKEELLRNPRVLSVSASNNAPIEGGYKTGIPLMHQSKIDTLIVNYLFVDEDFAKTYNLKIIKGTFLQMSSDGYWKELNKSTKEKNASSEYSISLPVVINETAMKMLGFDDPVGQRLGDLVIVGVVKDFNFRPLHFAIEPVIMTNNPEVIKTMNIKIAPGNTAETITNIRDIYKKYRDNRAFSYQFFEDILKEKYKAETRLRNITVLFAILAIVISIMGILGMTVFSIERRTKEIGIRKVSGARNYEILLLLNKEFLIWVVAAFLIASPVSWHVMKNWLKNFVYKTELSWWIFALAGLLALGIALLTVSWLSWRAATRNPVEALRYE